MRAPLLACLAPLLLLTACPAAPKQVGDVSSDSPPPKADEEAPKWEAAQPAPDKPKATGSAAGGRQVTEAPTRRSDQYDKDATEVVLKRAARQVKEHCGAAKGDDGKASGPWGKGTVQIQLGSGGRSKGVTVPAPYQGKPTGNCVEKAFANLTYPPWGGADAEVSWEIELVSPPAPEPTKK
jgi:hypothetical protein